jgi:hypothetical protein
MISIQTDDQYFEKFINQYQLLKKRFTRLKSNYNYESFIGWNRTLCSKSSDRRGPHQKVVAVSIYRDNPMFSWEKNILQFLKPLADEINILLPEWILRVYIDFIGSTKSQQEFLNNFSNVDVCDINNLPIFDSSLSSFVPSKMWRFLPIFDPYVDYLLSHDLNSPIIQRQTETIDVWLSNDQEKKFFYIARDNIEHSVPVLGGLWGAALRRARYELFTIFEPMLIPSIAQIYRKGRDQLFLRDYVWNFVKNNASIFDSYSCQKLHGRPFLSQRPTGNCYLGCVRPCCNSVIKSDFNVTLKPCPIECRPKEHLDWIYC